MKKTNQITYVLNEEDKKAIKRVYILLDEVDTAASMDDIIEVNENLWFQWREIQNLYEVLEKLLEADSLTLIEEYKE